MIDEIAINLWSSWNFTCIKNIIRTCNLTVRFSKFTFYIYKEFEDKLCSQKTYHLVKDLVWAWIKSKNKPCWPRISFMLKPNFSLFIFGLLTQIFYSANLELTHENWAHKCPYSTQWARVGNIPRLRSLFAGTDPGLGPGPMAQFFFLYLLYISFF